MRETLALASLTVSTTDGNPDFQGFDLALKSLRPVVTDCRKGERYLFLYSRLVCLKNEGNVEAAKKEVGTLRETIFQTRCGDSLREAASCLRSDPRLTGTTGSVSDHGPCTGMKRKT
jgi:hypothetical protein